MLNPHLQIHLVFIPMTLRVKFWDFRLRPPASPSCRLALRAGSHRGHRGLRPGGILDLWNRYALSI
jgi:hypothetical protein